MGELGKLKIRKAKIEAARNKKRDLNSSPVTENRNVQISHDSLSDKEKLQKRQVELEQELEISKLRLLINKQVKLLSGYNSELQKIDKLLLKNKAELANREELKLKSQEELESLKKRKIMNEGMFIRVSNKVFHARSELSKVKEKEKNFKSSSV